MYWLDKKDIEPRLYLLDRFEVMIEWDKVEPFFIKALKHNYEGTSINDVKNQALRKEIDIWFLLDDDNEVIGAMSTFLENRKKGMACCVYLISANSFKKNYKKWLHSLSSWAQNRGAQMLELHGRLGWEKLLKKDGFRKKAILLNMEL